MENKNENLSEELNLTEEKETKHSPMGIPPVLYFFASMRYNGIALIIAKQGQFANSISLQKLCENLKKFGGFFYALFDLYTGL